MEEQTKAEGRVSRRDLIRGGSEVVGAAAAISGGALFAQQTTGPGATTITTLGFGDIVPLTTAARIVVAAESVIGIVLVGLFLNAVGSQIKRSRDTGRDEKDLIGRRRRDRGKWTHFIAAFPEIPMRAYMTTAGREREASVDGREGSPLRDPAGRGGQPNARQLVHEPSVEGLAEHQTGRAV